MNKDLAADLNVAQQGIVDTFAQIQPLLRSYTQAKPKIRELRERLLAYLGRQDEEFFELLREGHRQDREAGKMIEFLAHDIKAVKVQYLIFFEKHSGEMTSPYSRDFPRDFMEFSKLILTRFGIEEEYLFPLIAILS